MFFFLLVLLFYSVFDESDLSFAQVLIEQHDFIRYRWRISSVY